ncbi:hypothetical protein TREPR_0030 [Treponema primitia ZAS-2]|uniref:Methyltransferase FkbM domain-containing protein n=1 Tax=Treponema primitia (strain ATCC BAA-887 / DSM 12427 / ZAS-2) TaxID=545694 RepID=F5YNX9_TREPZ|nr:FkbM family methyltransferase [Treponema primitia]AEF84347.1 hypothetical protein TREPR_0030 [Treponema primitia ZAS-2]
MKITKSLRQIIKWFVPFGIIEYRYKKSGRLNAERIQKGNDIAIYFKNLDRDNQDPEIVKIIEYLERNQCSMYPYEFTKKCFSENIVIYMDKICKMNYVLHENKRMYFPKNWEANQIREYYNWLLMEQDVDSPHRYDTAVFRVQEGDVIADLGTAEGFFALSNVEKAKKIYLFECDNKWLRALKKTFEPWQEKVSIVNKYISDTTSKNYITLDDFLDGKEINFIKADIEGAEIALLRGAKKTLLNQKKLQFSLCTYHRQNDAEEINQILTQNGFTTEYSKGYIITIFDRDSKEPYLRRGIIRAKNNESI